MMKHGQQPTFKSLFLGIVRPARDAHFCTVKQAIILTTKQLTHEENLYSRIAAGSFPCCRSTKPRYHELRRQGRILCNVRERRKDGETAIETDTLVYDGAANSFTLPLITYGDMVFS